MPIKWVWVNSISLTPTMMIHLHTIHKGGFRTLMHCGVKKPVLECHSGRQSILKCIWCLCIDWYLSYKGDKAYWMCTVSPIIYIFVCYSSYFFVFTSFLIFSSFWDFVGISFANPHETSLVHLGESSGLKGLLHTLNATVIPMKMS